MKTLLDILTDPNPSPRDRFIIETSKAIVAKSPRSGQADSININRALCAAIRYDVYPVSLQPTAYGLLYAKIAEACTFYRRFGKW